MPALVAADPPGLPLLVTREHALDAGLTHGQISWRVATGRWVVAARGIYIRCWALPVTTSAHSRREQLHVLHAAAASAARPGSTVALGSAALLHGMPLVSGPPAVVNLVVRETARREERAGVRSRAGALSSADTTRVPVTGLGLIAVTSPTRTWVDIARTGPLTDILSAGDAALRSGAMTRDDAQATIVELGTARGVRRARLALPLLDPLRESALESGSAARFIQWGFPAPRLQHEFRDDAGELEARSDFDWPGRGVIGFADGMGKYGLDPLRDRNERRQESRLRRHGVVARWGWVDMAGDGLPLFTLLAPLLGFTEAFRRAGPWSA